MSFRMPFLAVALMLAATWPGGHVAVEARAPEPALRGISSRVIGSVSSVRIEATDPLAYVTSRPDALTVLVDLRNVRVPAHAHRLAAATMPIGDVAVEARTESDGTPIARARISLTEDVPHRVRSTRNVIFVEKDQENVRRAALDPLVHRAPLDPIVRRAPLPPSREASADRRAVRVANRQTALLLSGRTATRRGVGGYGVPAQVPQPPVPAEPPPPPPPPQTTVPSASSAAQTIQPPTEPKRFTGHSVSLDFQGADLRAVLRTFAEISGLNIVIDATITGTVDVALRDVPWDQALDIILKANKLSYSVDDTIVRIAPFIVLAQEEEERRKLAEAQALAGELQVLTRALSYAKAQEMVPILTRSALSPRGDVQVDQRTNTLIIRDLADRLTTAEELIVALDKPERQVEIEARIVRVRRDYSRELGILWGFNGRMSRDLGNTTNLAFPNSGSVEGRTGGAQGPEGTSNAVNLPTQNAPTGAVGLSLGSVNGAFRLDVALQALEDQGKLRLLSSPRVSTQNNIEAEITQGTQIPLQTVANNTVTVSFKDAALTLRVTPQITASDTVILRISLEKAQADFSRSINGIPPIDTQRAVTNVLLSNGETTVIGGIFESQEVTGQASVPMLSRIPLLGWLFKNNAQSEFQDELMIFITPRILVI